MKMHGQADEDLLSKTPLELTKNICPAVWHLRLSYHSKPSRMLPLSIPPCRRHFHHAVLSPWLTSSQRDVYVYSSLYERLVTTMLVAIRLFGEEKSNTFADFGHLENCVDRGARILQMFIDCAGPADCDPKSAPSKHYKSGFYIVRLVIA